MAHFVTYPFSRNEDEGFDGMGLEVWRSLTLVGMGYSVAILAAIPIGFLLGGSPGFAKMFDPIFQIYDPFRRWPGFHWLDSWLLPSADTTKISMQHNCNVLLRSQCVRYGQRS